MVCIAVVLVQHKRALDRGPPRFVAENTLDLPLGRALNEVAAADDLQPTKGVLGFADEGEDRAQFLEEGGRHLGDVVDQERAKAEDVAVHVGEVCDLELNGLDGGFVKRRVEQGVGREAVNRTRTGRGRRDDKDVRRAVELAQFVDKDVKERRLSGAGASGEEDRLAATDSLDDVRLVGGC